MKKTIIWLVIIVVVIILVVIAVGVSRNGPALDNKTIKVAALLSLTGDAAAWGQNAERAIQLATEQINQLGGVNGQQLEVIYEDTGADPKRAVSAFQKVTAIDNVVAVIGPLNQTEDVAVAPIIKQTGTPTIVPGYLPISNRTNITNPIIVWMDAELEAGRLAQYLFDQGIRRVGIFGTLDSWESTVSGSFANRFKELGGVIVDKEIVQPDTAEVRLPITRLVASKPEAIFLGTYYQFVNSTKELHDLGYKGKLYGIEIDDYLANQTAAWTNGLQFIAPDHYQNDFIETFTNKYGMAPGLPAGQSYDAANILFSFLKQSINKAEILELMKSFSQYDGVSGQLEIRPDGRSFLPVALFELRQGEVSRVSNLP